jgi:hypothetical protein
VNVNHDGEAAYSGDGGKNLGDCLGSPLGGGLRNHAAYRGARPTSGYQRVDSSKTVNCVLAQLNDSMAKGRPPNFTHSVRIVTPGKVEEIVPQQIPTGSGELYVVRFVANDDGNIEVTVFRTLDGLDKRVQNAIDPCKKGNLAVKPAAQ